MSRIFQALERAERERTPRKQLPKEDGGSDWLEARTKSSSAFTSPKRSVERRWRRADKLARESTLEPPLNVDAHLVSLFSPTTFEAEQYRILCHNIEQIRKDAGVSVLVVSSPAAGDGKTTTAINIAGMLASLPATRVLLIDMDLRCPAVSRQLGLGAGPGLVEMIASPHLLLSETVRQYPGSTLNILTAGGPSSIPHETLTVQRVGEIFEEARRAYDYVILDSPPVLPFPDCQILGRWVDGFMLVIAAHKTPRKLIEEAIKIVNPTQLLGFVLNKDDRPVFGYYSYYTYADTQGARRSWLPRLVKRIGKFLSFSAR